MSVPLVLARPTLRVTIHQARTLARVLADTLAMELVLMDALVSVLIWTDVIWN